MSNAKDLSHPRFAILSETLIQAKTSVMIDNTETSPYIAWNDKKTLCNIM
jgi:hypothetical protein